MGISQLENQLAFQLDIAVGTGYERQYRFHPIRLWKTDFCWPDKRLCVEVEGGTWQGLGHNVGGHFHRDIEKYNELAIMGWRLIRVTGDMIRDGRAIRLIERALGGTP